MSAFFVTNETITKAIGAVLHFDSPLSIDRCTQLGRLMLANNADAVCARYPDEDRATYQSAVDGYVWQPTNQPLAVCYKSLRCFLYQCEEGDVHRTALHITLRAMCDRLEKMGLEESPEYESAAWG